MKNWISISRRFWTGTLVLGILFSIPGCSQSDSDTKPKPVLPQVAQNEVSTDAEQILIIIKAFHIEEGQRDPYDKITIFKSGNYVHVNPQGKRLSGQIEGFQAKELETIVFNKTHGTWIDDAELPIYELNLDYLNIVHEPKILELFESVTLFFRLFS